MSNCKDTCFPNHRCMLTGQSAPCKTGMDLLSQQDFMREVLYTGKDGKAKVRIVYNYIVIDNLKYEIYSKIPKWKAWVLTKILKYKVTNG